MFLNLILKSYDFLYEMFPNISNYSGNHFPSINLKRPLLELFAFSLTKCPQIPLKKPRQQKDPDSRYFFEQSVKLDSRIPLEILAKNFY
jgi:hypothetical protein